MRVVKSLGREQGNLEEFGGLSSEMYRAGYRAAWLSALFLPAVQIISALAVGMIIVYSGRQYMLAGPGGSTITIGGIQAFIGYVVFMLFPIQEMARVYAEMQQAIASGERIFSLIDSDPEIVDKAGAIDPGTLRGDIVFEDVDFYYEPDSPVLSGFNLTVRQGETIALVGPTGGGKSTIVNLICRFYEPKNGAIRISGVDYTDMTQHAIQSRIGIVLQTPHLFSGSIRENLRYGRLDATDEEVEAAAQMVGAHEFIVQLENGYDEEVGEGGSLLSVGQKQLDQPRTRRAGRPGHLHHGRGHQLRRHPDRGTHPAGHGYATGGAHQLRHRPSPVHHPPREPHPRHRGRPHRRDGRRTGNCCCSAATTTASTRNSSAARWGATTRPSRRTRLPCRMTPSPSRPGSPYTTAQYPACPHLTHQVRTRIPMRRNQPRPASCAARRCPNVESRATFYYGGIGRPEGAPTAAAAWQAGEAMHPLRFHPV